MVDVSCWDTKLCEFHAALDEAPYNSFPVSLICDIVK